jgi:hypothetical protein
MASTLLLVNGTDKVLLVNGTDELLMVLEDVVTADTASLTAQLSGGAVGSPTRVRARIRT